jgi:capsular polysaccharide export protein
VSDFGEPIVAAGGIARWKAAEIAAMLWDAPRASQSVFAHGRDALAAAQRNRGAVAIWPSRVPADFEDRATELGIAVWRLEDGFVRSIGLGSDCTPPASIVVDRRGIYYDASRPSDLECMIEAGGFPPELLTRADALMTRMVDSGIGKYEVGRTTIPLAHDGRRRVLVVGQVEDDLSVLTSGCGVTGNVDLLQRARAAEPGAMLVYRPHPDVDQGHRKGRIPDADALRYADMVVRAGTMAGLIEQVDAVHVLTSLAGFEALMRGKAVTTHGHPFYAGWGLTTDLAGAVARRTRRITLSELGAAALILYPRYMDPMTRKRCSVENLIDRIASADYRPKVTMAMRFRRFQARINRHMGRLRIDLGLA